MRETSLKSEFIAASKLRTLKGFAIVAICGLGLHLQAQTLDVGMQDIKGNKVSVEIHELQKQTLSQFGADPITLIDIDGQQVSVTRAAIGSALTIGKQPLFLGQARLLGEELTFTDIRFAGDSQEHYLQLAPEPLDETSPLSLAANRLTTQAFCGFFGYLMTGYQSGGKWKSEMASKYIKTVFFNTIRFNFPGVFAGFGSASTGPNAAPSRQNAWIATEIRCSTHMNY